MKGERRGNEEGKRSLESLEIARKRWEGEEKEAQRMGRKKRRKWGLGGTNGKKNA